MLVKNIQKAEQNRDLGKNIEMKNRKKAKIEIDLNV